MLPKFLRSSYKEYKADSDLVVDWLAKTAQRCGFSANYLHKNAVSSARTASKRQKAKTKSKLPQNPQSYSGTDDDDSTPDPVEYQPKWQLAVADLVKLAEFIAQAQPPVEVPLYLWSTLRKAIKERRRHNDWHSQRRKDKAQPQAANEGHGYFVDVLEKISNILEPFYTRSSVQRDKSGIPDESPQSHEEPSPEEEEQIAKEIRIAGESIDYTFIQGFEEMEEEACFAWQCLVMDYLPLKQYVNVLWMGYKLDKFGLIEVSVVTNAAIEFAKHLDQEFSATFPQFKPMDIYRCFTGKLSKYVDFVAGKPVDIRTASQDLIFSAYEAAGYFSFLPTQMQLLGFCEVLRTRTIPEAMPLTYDGYDASSDRTQKSPEEKYVEDRTIFHETLMELLLLAAAKDRPCAEDEITNAIRDLTDNQELSMWLIFAFQIFLDIHHIMRDGISKGYQDLQNCAKYTTVGLKQTLGYYGVTEGEEHNLVDGDMLRHTMKAIEQWVHFDIVGYMRLNTFTREFPGLAVPPPFYLLKRHPLRCGLIAFATQMSSQAHAIDLANKTGMILFAAHLYNLMRQEGLIETTWQDLNLALHFHRTETMFVGGFPKTATDCCKRYLLAIGVASAVDFSRGKRKNAERRRWTKNGTRGLNRISLTSMKFWYRYCQPREQASFAPEDIEHILRQGNGEKVKGDTLNLSEKLENSAQRYQQHATSSPGQDKYDPKLRRSFKARSVLLLDSLLRAIKSERLELSFNHFRLDIACNRLLRAVEQAVTDDIEVMCDAKASPDAETPPPFTVQVLMGLAMDAEKRAEALGIEKKDLDCYQPLIKAARVMETFLESGAGDIECMTLRSQGFKIDVPDVIKEG